MSTSVSFILAQFSRVSLSASGRPSLDEGEVILATQQHVGLYHLNTRLMECDDGIVYLTNYGIVWVNSGKAQQQQLEGSSDVSSTNSTLNYGWKLLHSRISDIKNYAGLLTSHPKILVYFDKAASDSSNTAAENQTESIPSTGSKLSVMWECSICQFSNQLIDSRALKCVECGVKNAVEDVNVSCPACTFKQSITATLACVMCETSWGIAQQQVVKQQSSEDAIDVVPADRLLVKYSFRAGGQPALLQKLKDALKLKAWENSTSSSVLNSSGGAKQLDQSSSAPLAQSGSNMIGGISIIMKNASEQQKQNEKTIDDAFQDLSALMKSAKEMVDLAQAISQKISKTDTSSADSQSFQGMLANLGLDDPVTRENSGNMYHQELAKQISEFALPLLYKSGGILSLAELYCIYNRARGVALISPEDLSKSCKLCEQLNLPVRMKKFESGLKVLQTLEFNESAVAERIVNHLTSQQGTEYLTAITLSELEQISILLAKEHLIAAESMGKVCRDESMEGLRFYRNRFTALNR